MSGHPSAIEYSNYDQAIIVTGDGDFACLIKYLTDKEKLTKIIVPTARYSKLLKPYKDYILPLNIIKDQIK